MGTKKSKRSARVKPVPKKFRSKKEGRAAESKLLDKAVADVAATAAEMKAGKAGTEAPPEDGKKKRRKKIKVAPLPHDGDKEKVKPTKVDKATRNVQKMEQGVIADLAKTAGKAVPKVQAGKKDGEIKTAVEVSLNGPSIRLGPANPVKPKKVCWDFNGNSCVVTQLRHDGEQVLFVTMENCFVDRYKLPRVDFERRFKELKGYPLDRCLQIYRRVGGENRITERAKRSIDLMLGIVTETSQGDDDMATKKKGSKKANGAAKTPKFDKAQFLSRDKAADLIKKNPKAKLSRNRDNDKREGSLPRATLDAIMQSSNVEAALKKQFTHGKKKHVVSFSDLRSAVRRRYVNISK